MSLLLKTVCPCLPQDVPLLSSTVQVTSAAIPAVQERNVASNTKASTTASFMTLGGTANNTYKSGMLACGTIQQTSFGESRESQREVYSMEELLQYEGMDGIALPDAFLHQYYSQVRHEAA